MFRNAVLDLAEVTEFARPLVNSGRLSVPATYDGSSLNSDDCAGMPSRSRPGSPAADAPTTNGWLLDQLGNKFQLLAINAEVPDTVEVGGITISALRVSENEEMKDRYLGDKSSAVYLMRPDQHVAARWETYDEARVAHALNCATGIFAQEAAQ